LLLIFGDIQEGIKKKKNDSFYNELKSNHSTIEEIQNPLHISYFKNLSLDVITKDDKSKDDKKEDRKNSGFISNFSLISMESLNNNNNFGMKGRSSSNFMNLSNIQNIQERDEENFTEENEHKNTIKYIEGQVQKLKNKNHNNVKLFDKGLTDKNNNNLINETDSENEEEENKNNNNNNSNNEKNNRNNNNKDNKNNIDNNENKKNDYNNNYEKNNNNVIEDNNYLPYSSTQNDSEFFNSFEKSKYTPISHLTTFTKEFLIYVRVLSKSEKKIFSKNRSGHLFSFIVIDEFSSQIQIVCFDKLVDKYYDYIQENNIYEIRNGNIKINDRNFNNTNNDYKIILNENSSVNLINKEDNKLKKISLDLKTIKEIKNLSVNSVINIIYIIINKGEIIKKNKKG
jgi:hypothetical protein